MLTKYKEARRRRRRDRLMAIKFTLKEIGLDTSASDWTPQSLVVEDAAPTHVVMTGSVANTTSVAGDFAPSNGAMSSISRDVTNKIITGVLSVAVNNGDVLTITYKGVVYAVTNNVAAWTPLKSLGGETPSYWYQDGTRSGLTLPNAMSPGTGDKSILLPHLNTFLATNGYAGIADNGSMDIINNLGTNPLGNADQGYTICGVIDPTDRSKTAVHYYFGKMIAGGRIGRFGIYSDITTGYVACYLQSSGGTVSITSGIDITALTFPHVLMDVNYTTKKIRLFVNGVQKGSDTSFTGTLSALGNAYSFYLGAQNTDVTGVARDISKTSFVDIKTFNKILTPTEIAQEYATHDVSGAINH